jgi:hypothetical protein
VHVMKMIVRRESSFSVRGEMRSDNHCDHGGC